MNKWCTLLLAACSLLLSSCQEPASVRLTIDHVANATKLADGTYEVQLRYSDRTSGGPCFNDGWFKTRTYYATNWLYLKSIEQTANADQLIVTTDKGATDLAIKDLKGTVSFDNGAMTVQLEQPHILRSGAARGYVPYYLNGTYQIAR